MTFHSNQTELGHLHAAVDAFAAAMKAKLLEGYWGWDDPYFAPIIRQSLEHHVRRGEGQEVDIANLAMMLWHFQQPSKTPQEETTPIEEAYQDTHYGGGYGRF